MPVFTSGRAKMFAAAAFFLLLGVFLRTVMPKPHVWVFAFLSWAAACGFSAGAARPLAAKYGWLVIMSVFLALFAAEGWLSLGATGVMPAYVKADIDEVRKERGDATLAPYMSNIEKYDPVLGARPRAAASRTASRFYRDGRMLYDVVYSTLDSGWRVTPQNPDADKAVVFFGCSFTFGQGLEDEQTIPWRVAELLGPEYQVFNFALYGYGAHQMLAQIENGFVDDIARRYQDVQAFFLTIDGHELRCSGFEEWVKSGPLYAEENGRVVYKGDIRNMDRPSLPPLRKMLRNCLVFQSIVGSTPPQSREMRELHAAIVAESARQMREKYHAPLTVLLWPDAPFEGQLRGRGLDPVSLVPALPDWETARSGYYIPYDGHPNALGADHVARFIAARVQKRAAAQAPESE